MYKNASYDIICLSVLKFSNTHIL